MKQVFTIVIFILLCGAVSWGSELPEKDKTSSISTEFWGANHPRLHESVLSDLLIADLDFLFQTISDVHPNMHVYTSADEFKQIRRNLYENIKKPLTPLEFFKLAAPAVAAIKNGHTTLLPPLAEFEDYAKGGGTLFPLDLYQDNDAVFINKNYSPIALPSDGEILAINGRAVTDVAESISRCFSGEGRSANPGIIANGNLLRCWFWLEFGPVQTWNIKIAERKGDEGVFSLPALNLAKITQESGKATSASSFNYRLVKDDLAALLTINDWSTPKELKSFLDGSFKDIMENRLENLIIDIRCNPGGSDQCVKILIEYLTENPYRLFERTEIKISKLALEKSQVLRGELSDAVRGKAIGSILNIEIPLTQPARNKYRYTGRTFVLIGRSSFSASTTFAATVKCYNLGTLIGEQTGDPTELYADSLPFQLQNSQLVVQVASKLMVMAGESNGDQGVLPDYHVSSEPQSGRDDVLEFALNLLRTPQTVGNPMN